MPFPRRAALAAALCAGLLLAGSALAERVAFKPGANAATLSGSLGDSRDYVLAAKAGQTLTVSLKGSTNAYFNVLPPGSQEALVNSSISGENRWSGRLPASGDYTVRVYQMRAATRQGKKSNYTISFSIK
ncbi:hypothetical protein DX914_08175 [Lysobacter silvisoli]|uniref:G-type lysozyme inhibitor n=2 Tax=Lysobacter silvisoli TaxID=2293254 RepID=A0A371K5C4_9GAMM|nr:hypothetical protein DX914_08175 [Lysobacter silvisoli]